jgi:hypothetical protein
MNSRQIQKFVMRYLEAEQCGIIEKSPAHVTVKLSPEADKYLTNRPYYWSFVERTGAEPETMTFTFVFDAKKLEELEPAKPPAAPADSILGRYFGVSVTANPGRIPREELVFGSRRLMQIFSACRQKGRFVQLFEEPGQARLRSLVPNAYSSWLCVNYKVEFACDMKRDELHSLGIDLGSGEIVEGFHERMKSRKLTPRLPAQVHLTRHKLTLAKALSLLETHLERKLKTYDHSWADEAHRRLEEEEERIRSYYEGLLESMEEEKKQEVQDEFANRLEETAWQYQPRILASVINCGFFHLHEPPSAAVDESR